MTTGAIMFYAGAAMLGAAAVIGLPVLFALERANKKIRNKINSDFR